MIRILHCVSNMDRAGIETILMNYYRYIDRSEVQFDFLCNKSKKGAYDDEIISMGGRIYHTPGLNPFKYPKYLKYMKKFFKDHTEYKVIEAHNGALGVYALYPARLCSVPVRIFHAHGADIAKDIKLPLKLFCKSSLKHNTTHNFTCGIAAAECYFGKDAVKKNNYQLIPNAIEIEKFLFNNDIRNSIRNKYSLNNKHIIGHVGRFMTQKNHKFLIDVFEELCKIDEHAYLVMLGDGELMESMKKKVTSLGLDDKVLFMGNVPNANEWYSAFDVFVLPSFWEGLPVVGIEAQASDLPCIFSDGITREIGITDKSEFLSLKLPAAEWAAHISDKLCNNTRIDNSDIITDSNYNIKAEAVKLENKYIELYGENKL